MDCSHKNDVHRLFLLILNKKLCGQFQPVLFKEGDGLGLSKSNTSIILCYIID